MPNAIDPTRERVNINLNDTIIFTLTEKGKKKLFDPYVASSLKQIEGDTYSTQFWVFCQIFGPDINIGFNNDIYSNVQFVKMQITT